MKQIFKNLLTDIHKIKKIIVNLHIFLFSFFRNIFIINYILSIYIFNFFFYKKKKKKKNKQ